MNKFRTIILRAQFFYYINFMPTDRLGLTSNKFIRKRWVAYNNRAFPKGIINDLTLSVDIRKYIHGAFRDILSLVVITGTQKDN